MKLQGDGPPEWEEQKTDIMHLIRTKSTALVMQLVTLCVQFHSDEY